MKYFVTPPKAASTCTHFLIIAADHLPKGDLPAEAVDWLVGFDGLAVQVGHRDGSCGRQEHPGLLHRPGGSRGRVGHHSKQSLHKQLYTHFFLILTFFLGGFPPGSPPCAPTELVLFSRDRPTPSRGPSSSAGVVGLSLSLSKGRGRLEAAVGERGSHY